MALQKSISITYEDRFADYQRKCLGRFQFFYSQYYQKKKEKTRQAKTCRQKLRL